VICLKNKIEQLLAPGENKTEDEGARGRNGGRGGEELECLSDLYREKIQNQDGTIRRTQMINMKVPSKGATGKKNAKRRNGSRAVIRWVTTNWSTLASREMGGKLSNT